MPVFWITINPVDLRYLLVIHLAGVELELSSKIQSVFQRKTAIMNPVALAKFFHIIYNAKFMSLFSVDQIEGGFFGLISNCLGIVEANGSGMLHLYCLVWLKYILYLLPMLQTQLQSKMNFVKCYFHSWNTSSNIQLVRTLTFRLWTKLVLTPIILTLHHNLQIC